MEFTPPMSERSIDELISIANSTEDYWQLEAIKQARLELTRQGVTEEPFLFHFQSIPKSEQLLF